MIGRSRPGPELLPAAAWTKTCRMPSPIRQSRETRAVGPGGQAAYLRRGAGVTKGTFGVHVAYIGSVTDGATIELFRKAAIKENLR